MTRSFDDTTLTFMKNTIDDTKVKSQAYKISLLILKISFLTLFGCRVKINQINPIFGYRVKITPDIKPINGLTDLSWWFQKGMTIVRDLMLLVISLLTLLMSVGCNIPLILTQYVVRWIGLVLTFLKRYDTCM